jgi:hypothetical protein
MSWIYFQSLENGELAHIHKTVPLLLKGMMSNADITLKHASLYDPKDMYSFCC